ncbi:MAG: hypothetical protein L6R41_000431 [Letrouitia leprolyta]|nr:MAG: hypothetical protein L6R41_000431 [Letrouitia leprolyta]
MATTKNTVAKSYDVRDAALNLAAKAYDVRRTVAAVWNVKPTAPQSPSPEATFSLDMTNSSEESVVDGGDERVLVDKSSFAPGGKYRSIVKLFIHYEFQKPGSWAMGTGWLIAPDIFVTAGHCSYDWSHQLGRATEVKAYIGYDGRQSEKDSKVQFRQVKTVVTTEGWVTTKGQKPFDVSFMQVDRPFTGITPIRFEDTPAQGSLALGVVGYPGDLKDPKTGEKGAHMYEMFMPTEFDLATQADTMLEYRIDTFGGNSGSPVLRQEDLVSIGAHVYGGTLNSASVIGRYGNPYHDYLNAFNIPLPNDGLNLVPVVGNTIINAPLTPKYSPAAPKTATAYGQRKGFQSQRVISTAPKSPQSYQIVQRPRVGRGGQLDGNSEEGFMDILKTVASAVPAGLGLIGGGPIGALAGFALNAASSLVTETTTAESTVDSQSMHEGSMERAILAEAALQALQAAKLNPDLEEGIFDDIKDTVMKALPVIRKTAPRVMGAMMEPALKIALDSLSKYNQKVASGAESFEDDSVEPFRPTTRYTSAIDQAADRQVEAFLGPLQQALQQNIQESGMDDESEEGFIDIIKAGARLAGKGVTAAAKHGLPILMDLLKQTGSAEAFEDESTSVSNSQLLAADPLAMRALVADAALQAVMRVPAQQLQEEGIFDFIGDAVKKIAPIAISFAPTVAKAIHPTIGKIVGGVLGQESAFDGGSSNSGRNKFRLDVPRGLSAKRSLQSLREGNVNGNGARGRIGQTEFFHY